MKNKIKLFSDGKINSKEVISKYNSYYERVREERLKNLKDNRVSGDIAHKLNQEKLVPKSFIKKVRKIINST